KFNLKAKFVLDNDALFENQEYFRQTIIGKKVFKENIMTKLDKFLEIKCEEIINKCYLEFIQILEDYGIFFWNTGDLENVLENILGGPLGRKKTNSKGIDIVVDSISPDHMPDEINRLKEFISNSF
ncbi:MAG: hypothetical protein HeimC3_25340, partial [Candidatus Heimdallarchaeota archaeon LC_3]